MKLKKDGTPSKRGGKREGSGRPTKFKPKYIQRLIKFFDIEPYKKEIIESTKEFYASGGVKKETERFKYIPSKLPTLYKFARSIGVSYWTVWSWAEKGESEEIGEDELIKKFANAYKEAKELQKEFLINIGLAGAAPAPFAIFTAKNITDMRDKVEHESPVAFNFFSIIKQIIYGDTSTQPKRIAGVQREVIRQGLEDGKPLLDSEQSGTKDSVQTQLGSEILTGQFPLPEFDIEGKTARDNDTG